MRFRRCGLTLIEILVVIAIISLLVGLSIPAVLAARESARRTACANNLKQIGLGFHQYNSIHQRFPRGNWRVEVAILIEPNRGTAMPEFFRCPNQPDEPRNLTCYGMDYGFIQQSRDLMEPTTWSSTKLVLESSSLVSWQLPSFSDFEDPSSFHGQGRNTLWADGHVSYGR